MDLEMIEYYHDIGLMPDWAYYQQNGKSAQYNYEQQTRKIKDSYIEQKRIEELKRKIQDEIFQAVMVALENGAGNLEQEVANDVVNSIQAAFNGGSIHPEALHNKTFSAELGAMLGRALGEAPFKLLDEIFSDDDHKR